MHISEIDGRRRTFGNSIAIRVCSAEWQTRRGSVVRGPGAQELEHGASHNQGAVPMPCLLFVGPNPIVKVSVIRRDPRTVQPGDGHAAGEPLPALAHFSARGPAIFLMDLDHESL